MSSLKEQFPTATREAEEALREWGIGYEKQDDGTLLVKGNLNIADKDLPQLPDLSCVIVTGNFDCSHNQLSTLAGAPQSAGDFDCSNNKLVSLEGAPPSVRGSFLCSHNELASLEGAPQTVAQRFFCYDNPMEYLEGSPLKFRELYSDLGVFSSYESIPEHLRISPETRVRLKEEFERATDCSRGIEADMDAPKRIQFTRKTLQKTL